MPDRVNEHGSGAVPLDAYQPGSHALNPGGLSHGVRAMPSEAPIPPRPKRVRRVPPEKRKPGRPVGSKNRPPPTEEMFDGPPDDEGPVQPGEGVPGH